MAIFHFEANTGTRSGGQSARAKFDYIAREGSKHEHRDPRLHIESGHMPAFAAADAVAYWSAADEHERANGRLFKHLEIALHRELTFEQNTTLARDFVEKITSNIGGGNLPYTFTIHAGGARDASQTEISKSNIHCDVMISERVNDGIYRGPSIWFSRVATGKNKTTADGGAKKTDALKPEEWLKGARKLWAEMSNQAFAEAGLDVRIDHRTLLEQRAEALAKGDLARAAALDRAPGEHIGPRAAGYEARTGLKSNRRKHIESRQRERSNIARKVVAVDLATSRYESQIRADQDALRRERGLRTKDAITRRIAAERAASKVPAPAAEKSIVSSAPAAASQPKKPASPAPTGKPKFRSAKIAVAVDHKANATIQQKIRKEEQATLDFLESLRKKEQESLEKFMREMRNALESHDEQQEQPRTRAPAPAPVPGVSQAQRAATARRVLESMNAKPAPAPAAAPAASQPQVSTSPATVVDRPVAVDPVAAAESARRESAERRIRLALSTGKGKSAALVDAVRNADAGSIEQLVEAGADPTTNAHKAFKEAGSNREVVKALVQGMISNRTIQDHANLSSLAAQLPPEAAAQVREMAAAAKTGGSLSAAGFTEPSTPSSPQSPDISSGPSIDTGGGKGS